MACPSSPINYQPGGRGCCRTMQNLMQWIVSRNPAYFYANGCFVQKTIAGSKNQSVHGTGRAGDISIKNSGINSPGNQSMEWLINTLLTPLYCQLGIQRMIFQRRIWDPKSGPNLKHVNWRAFTGPQSHIDHLHIEIHPDFCGTLGVADINVIVDRYIKNNSIGDFGYDKEKSPNYKKDPAVPTPTITPLPPESSQPTTPTVTVPGSGARGTGTTRSGADTVSAPTITSTAPVWSSTIPEYGPCKACGSGYDTLTEDEVLSLTHCGGTGAICVVKSNGAVCAAGTANSLGLGSFGGPVKDAFLYGNGAYALSADGDTVYYTGADASAPVFKATPGLLQGSWDNIYLVKPGVIGLSKRVGTRVFSTTAQVTNIAANKFSCC